MNYKLLEVESRLFNCCIIQLADDIEASDYAREEKSLLDNENPYYIQHQLDAADLSGIHAFESLGFRFVEFRISRYLQPINPAASSKYSYPYAVELIGDSPENRKAIIGIASQHNSDDRFTRDPLIPDQLAKKRLELYITKSLQSFPRQFVYGLYNQHNNELLGFRTGIFADSTVVKYFYYFMKPAYNNSQYISILETGVHEALLRRKVTRIEAITSGFNVDEMNESSLMQGFVVDKTMVLLRKIF